jgi:hypothetical protein
VDNIGEDAEADADRGGSPRDRPALVVWGWVYWRVVVMLLGIAIAFVGAAGPFWLMNAS